MQEELFKQAIIQTILESAQQYYKLLEEEEKKGSKPTTTMVEIDIDCRKSVQVAKIYAMLVLIDKLPWPSSQKIQHEVDKILQSMWPELKKHLLRLGEKDKDKHLVYEDRTLAQAFPGLKAK
jgi:putative lipoic acid-binding regulatory protein